MINLLFGKKKFVKTKYLGTFAARVKRNSTKERSWISTIKIENYSDEIVIILEGDANGPFAKQIDSASKIISELNELDLNLARKISNDPALKAKYEKVNLTDFRLACLNPWDETRNSFELSYESRLDDSIGVSVIIQNGQILEID